MRRFVPVLAFVSAIACGSHPTTPDPPPPPVGDPAITCPANVSVTTADTATVVTYDAPLVTGGTPPATASCSPASGTSVPVGTTAAKCTVTDAINRSAVCNFSITVTVKAYLRYTRIWGFGDSLTWGEVNNDPLIAYGFQDLSNNYPTVLQGLLRDRYTQQTISVSNYGAQGETAANGADRLRASLIAGPVPDVLLLLEGSNEMSTRNDEIIASIVNTLSVDIEEARVRGVKAVLLATFPPVGTGSRGAAIQPYIAPVNSQVRALAASRAPYVTLVDLNLAMAGQESTLIGRDGLHPTPAGYHKMAETFFATLKSTFETPTPPSAALRFRR